MALLNHRLTRKSPAVLNFYIIGITGLIIVILYVTQFQNTR